MANLSYIPIVLTPTSPTLANALANPIAYGHQLPIGNRKIIEENILLFSSMELLGLLKCSTSAFPHYRVSKKSLASLTNYPSAISCNFCYPAATAIDCPTMT